MGRCVGGDRLKIVVVSDQHGNLPNIPPCDLLIISGDITEVDYVGGKWRPDLSNQRWHLWLKDKFRRWIEQKARCTVAVAGNHDNCIDKFGWPDIPSLHPLHDSDYEHVDLKLWGAPWVRKWDQMCFGITDEELDRQWSLVPNDTDVVVCHHPPLGYGDGNGLGCKAITDMIRRVKPRLVTCGHIHEGRGTYYLDGTTIINAACGFEVIYL